MTVRSNLTPGLLPLTVLLFVVLVRAELLSAFVPSAASPKRCTAGTAQRRSRESGTVVHAKTTKKTSLSEDTTWKLRFLLQGLPTESGKKVDEIFTVSAKFVEETGYEPPQGQLVQQPAENDRLRITGSRWILSEDPNERKDGLWVWGLFAEPLYPFLLLQLETDRVELAGEEEDAIKPLKLFVQLNHQREKDVGVLLKGGEVKVREMETIKADPFGAATVDVYDEVSVGSLSIEPTND